ncbi:aminopeptidase N-like [Scaptodrosophila lebanonensis]|uniref:Aminopeptidase n=1 Tax=Drosophila lebanonensis TaxID=7225 RepID=A0A6J2T4J1_DROLE|nr:aminopeptidase N-like [Scaptodrosophila lebanonensis]
MSLQRLSILLAILCGYCDAQYTHYRLPKAVKPLTYNVEIKTNLEDPANLNFTGEVQIDFVALSGAGNNITLHAAKYQIDPTLTILINQENSEIIKISDTQTHSQYEFYILNLEKKLEPGVKYKLALTFSGKLSQEKEGYFVNTYKDHVTNETKYMTATQFQPTAARYAFPCFDEPDLKANFTIRLVRDKKYTALSNMPLLYNIADHSTPALAVTTFETTVPMPTYLVAFSLSEDFKHTITMKTDNGIEFRTWTRPDPILLKSVSYANAIGFKLLMFYEYMFNMKYPLPKVDMLAVPGFNGAMENWGLIKFNEPLIVYSSKGSIDQKIAVATIVAHEVTHQWFGNLVTLNWWSDIWLNEGFATYFSGVGLENADKNLHILSFKTIRNLQNMFNSDAHNDTEAVSRKITEVSEIREAFDDLSYKKGGLLLRMLHYFIGDASFMGGLREYLAKYAYRNADKNDLWNTLSDKAHKNKALPENIHLATIMESWVSQPGYPIIHVARNYADNKTIGTINITQERFLYNSQTTKRDDCWWIPLSYTTSAELNFENTIPKHWFQCDGSKRRTMEVKTEATENDWILFNLQMTGFYKINYDMNNWKLLISTLNSDKFESIHTLNRAQLVDDVMKLAWNNVIDYYTALELVSYMGREHEYEPWMMAISNLDSLNTILRHSSQYGEFEWYIKYLITPIYKHLDGMNNNLMKLGTLQKKLKIQILGWACYHNVLDCAERAAEMFAVWRNNPEPDKQNPIPLDMRATVYCTAIRNGRDDDWKFLWERYTISKEADDRVVLLSSLACTSKVWLLQRLIEALMQNNGPIPEIDTQFALESIASQTIGFHLTKAYVIEYFANVMKNNTQENGELTLMGTLLDVVLRRIVTPVDMKSFSELVQTHKKITGEESLILEAGVKEMAVKVHWRVANSMKIFQAIKKLKQRVTPSSTA